MANKTYQLTATDGTKIDFVAVDNGDGTYSAGTVPISSALPTGASTSAKQDAEAVLIGAVDETAPATDTASSGANGRLQRIAQRLTSLIALIPAALGQGTMAQSLRVVLASDQSPVTIAPGVPTAALIVIGALNGSGAQAAADITGADVGANKTFVGNVHISAAAQNPAATATGSVIATITWVPGSSGSTARRVATVNLELAATAAAVNGISDSDSIAVPVTVYAGTTAGKFQVAIVVAGTVTAVLWDAVVNGYTN